jgi:hypothetical protein
MIASAGTVTAIRWPLTVSIARLDVLSLNRVPVNMKPYFLLKTSVLLTSSEQRLCVSKPILVRTACVTIHDRAGRPFGHLIMARTLFEAVANAIEWFAGCVATCERHGLVG